MCGINGIAFSQNSGKQASESQLIAMRDILYHRGPDDGGALVDGNIGLAMRRLAIVDVAHGAQPICNRDRSVSIVYNGEVYNHAEHRADLIARGYEFQSRSDTETILHLYEEYGRDCVEYLRGMFAFAIWDKPKRELFIARDRFGVKPLYYAHTGGSIIFASEMKALFNTGRLAPELDSEQLLHVLGGIMLPSATLFRGVHQVEPGTFVRVHQTHVTHVRYWDFADVQRSARASEATESDGELVEEFKRRLEEAIRLRLDADVEVGLYLSGGVDSASVAMLAAQAARRKLKCFTVGFAGAFDESDAARRVAERLGLEWHVRFIEDVDLQSNFERSLWHGETPVPNAHGVAKFLLSELAGAKVKVVLTGEGADELLGGYAHFRHVALLDRARRSSYRSLAAELGALTKQERALTGVVRASRLLGYENVTAQLGAYPYAALRNRVYRPKVAALLAPPLRRAAAAVDSLDALGRAISRSRLAGLSALDATQYVGIKTDLPNYMLSNLGDRQEMAHSVEGRLPFLDHLLAELTARMSWDKKVRDGVNKYVLRKAMESAGHGAEAARKKGVFLAPSLSGLVLGEHGPLAEQYLSRAAIHRAGLFDANRVALVRAIAGSMRKGTYWRGALENLLTAVLSVQVLHAIFCRDFRSSVQRYRTGRLDYRSVDGDVRASAAPVSALG